MTLLAAGVKLLLAAPGPADPGGPSGRIARRLHTAVGYYRREISPNRPPCCRFTPTCSAYAQAALAEHGALRGSWLTVRRLLRCRPGVTRGTADPLPA
jgi:putative membrane protein insertion efficiency factor